MNSTYARAFAGSEPSSVISSSGSRQPASVS